MAAVVCLWHLVAPARADVIWLRADEWCPYNCAGERKGYGVEVAEEVFTAAGHQIQYLLSPWSRALEDCLRGRIDAVIGAAPVDSPDLVFGAEPIGVWDSTFAVRRGQSWRYQGLQSLEAVKFSAIIGYIYMEPVGGYIEAHKKDRNRIIMVGGTSPLDQGLKMVAAGRIDATLDSQAVLQYKFKQLGLADQLQLAGGTETGPIYIAFSPQNPKARQYAALLDQGIRTLRQSGRLKQILDSYGVRDWK